MLDCFNIDHVKFDYFIKLESAGVLKVNIFPGNISLKINISDKSF